MAYLFALIVVVIGIVLLLQSERKRRSVGLPRGRVIYSDTGSWGEVDQPLYDRHLGLTGKPDYLVESGENLIPVEVKSTRAPAAPYDAHIFQLAAYCLLVESHFGRRPPYGILHYADRTYAIDYTFAMEEALLDVVDNIRQSERKRVISRSHEQPARCKGCGYRGICDQRL